MQRLALAPWFRTIAFDNRGAGRSDKPFGHYSLEQMADDVICLMDALEVDDPDNRVLTLRSRRTGDSVTVEIQLELDVGFFGAA